jgi:branched-chain amino acid transport system substrate-binding protein
MPIRKRKGRLETVRNSKVILFTLVLVALLVAMPSTVGCAQKGVTPTEKPKGEIRIGDLTDLTGPLSALYTISTQALEEYASYINEQGGINGHPVKIISVDTRYDVAAHISGYEKLRTADKVHAIHIDGSGGSAAIKPRADQDKTAVMVSPELTALLPATNSYTFAYAPNYIFRAQVVMPWIKSHWKGTTAPRIGLAMEDVVWVWTQRTALEALAKEYGWKIDPITITPPGAVDVTSEVLKHIEAKEDYLFIGGLLMVPLLNDPRMAPIPPMTTIYPPGNMSSILMPALLGQTKGQGIVAPEAFRLWHETDAPSVKLAHELAAKYHPDVKYRGAEYWWAMSSINVLCEALKRAIDKVGYDNLDGTAIKAALETFKDFNNMGITAPITYTSTDHLGPRAMRIIQYKAGNFEVISDWISPPAWPSEWWNVDYWKK